MPDSLALDLPMDLVSFNVDQGGNYVLGPDRTLGRFAVFAHDGSLLRVLQPDTAESSGSTLVRRIYVGPGDSAYAFDRGRARVSVFSPDGKFVRTQSLIGSADDVVMLPGSMLVMGGIRRTPEAIGFPIHVFGPGMAHRRSFGIPDGNYGPNPRIDDYRRLTSAGSPRAFWASRLNAYSIERWSTDGAREVALKVEVPWFQQWTSDRLAREDSALPQPTITAIGYDDGVLWVTIKVADEHWRARAAVGRGNIDRPLTVAELAPYVDTRIDAIDASTGTLLASVRNGDPLIASQRGQYMLRIRQWVGREIPRGASSSLGWVPLAIGRTSIQ